MAAAAPARSTVPIGDKDCKDFISQAEAQVFFVPYLLPQDTEKLGEFFRTSKAINEMFPELYAEQGLELLTMFPEGEVCMTTQEPVTGPPDLDQVKFRVMTNPLLVESYKAFGATPTPLPELLPPVSSWRVQVASARL